MRFTGILRTWHDDRGFGFIAPTQGGREIFVHVSALPRDGTRPTVGETLSYELGTGKDGKPQAINVHRQAFGPPQARRREPDSPMRRPRNIVGSVIKGALVLCVAAYGYNRYASRAPATAPEAVMSMPAPRTVVVPSTEPQPRVVPSADTSAANPRCDGRRFCSQMTSCAEATFFLKNCPGTQMDGNRDGVPCEQQWCR